MVKLLGAATAIGVAGVSRRANAARALEIGTLFPAASPWGRALETWATAVDVETAGALRLQFGFNGQHGDEDVIVAKAKSGKLDGAAVSAVGLGKIYEPVLALHLPGLFTQWTKLDAARDALSAELEQGIVDAGFDMIAWFDLGAVRWMSQGFQARVPADLAGKKPWMWRPDVVQGALYSVVGGVSPVPLAVSEVLPSLNTGGINVIAAPALVAEQLRFSRGLDTLTTPPSSLAIGGIVLSSPRFAALPTDLRQIVIDTGKVAGAAMRARIRKEDAAAFNRLKGKTTVVTPSAAEQAKWDAIYKKARRKLASGTFAPELVARLEGLAE